MGLAESFAKSINTDFFLKCGLLNQRRARPHKQRAPRQEHPLSNKKNLKHLLASLENSFFIMKHAGRYIAQNPAFCFGAHMVWLAQDDGEGYYSNKLEFFDYHHTPSAFMVLIQFEERNPDHVPMLLIAEKISPKNGHVEYTTDATYYFGRFYIVDESRSGKRLEKPIVLHDRYYVAVSKSGEVRALKQKMPYRVARGNKRSSKEFYNKTRFRFPKYLTESKFGGSDKEGIEGLFCISYNLHSRRSAGCQIYAERKPARVVFSVPDSDFKTFFSDRIPVIQNGIKKRILHWVKAHQRTREGGGGSFVKTHLRGLTDFTWNGTNVKIRLDGYNSKNSSSFGVTPMPDGESDGGVFVNGETLFNAVVGAPKEQYHRQDFLLNPDDEEISDE